MKEYKYKGKIPVFDAYPEYENENGEWKEYHTNDIADIKFNYFISGWGIGALMSGICFAVYFMR